MLLEKLLLSAQKRRLKSLNNLNTKASFKKLKQFKYMTRRFMLQLALAINVLYQLINNIARSEE
jgi:hypothetical protein